MPFHPTFLTSELKSILINTPEVGREFRVGEGVESLRR